MRILVVLVISALTAAAQSPLQDWNQVKALAPGTEIRVERSGGPSVRGQLQNATDESLVIAGGSAQQTLPRPQVARVSVRGKGHRGRNAVIGLAVGAGVGLAIGFAIRGGANQLKVVSNGAVEGGSTAVVAILGTVVGVAIPTGGWRAVYRR